MNIIRVLQVGMGPIGIKTTRFLVEKRHLQIVGAVDIDPKKVGRDLGELTGASEAGGVKIAGSVEDALAGKVAEVAVVTTTSSLEKAKSQILEIVSLGVNVVSTCEELSFPWKTLPTIAEEIDEVANVQGVSVLGTGVNPGFMMDLLPLAMTAVCRDVKRITVSRIQDARHRRLPFQRKIGAGLTPEQFDAKKAEGTLRHVGLTESMHMIAARLGWELTHTEDTIEPVMAESAVETKDLRIEAGQARGVNQIGRARVGEDEVITLIFRAAVAEPDPHDRIQIEGDPPIDLRIDGGVNGDVATCAIAVNAISSVVRARPGLRTMADIEPVTFR